MPTLRTSLRDLFGVFADGFRVLAAHWPTLIALYLAGFACRMGTIWLAVRAGRLSTALSALILPFAPLATIVSFVLMLRVAAESLPAFRNALVAQSRGERWREHLKIAALALVPFLAVYATQGLLKEDVQRFVLDAGAAEWARADAADYTDIDWSRANLATGPLAVGIAVAAMVARKVIAGLDLGEKNARWAAASGYLEALWMSSLSVTFVEQRDAILDWLTSRRVVAGLYRWWEGLLASFDALDAWVRAPFELAGKLIATMGSLVIVPVAWLAIGATVYGSQLKGSWELPTHEQATARLSQVPSPIRRAVGHVIEPVTTPIKNTAKAIGKVASAGVLPMVLFCVVFAVTGWLRVGVDHLAWLVMGPASQELQAAREPYVLLVEGVVYFVITLALLSAAVNHVIGAQQEAEAEAGVPESTVTAEA